MPRPPAERLVELPYFAYRGGKARLRRFIIRWCPLVGKAYVEPFAGRGNLFFLMRGIGKFRQWHLNDLKTLPFYEAIQQYDGSPLPILTKEEAKDLTTSGSILAHLMEPIIRWAGGLASEGASATGNRGHDLTQYRKRLLIAKRNMQGVTLTARDATDIVQNYMDDEEAFLYLDPPYVGANVGSYEEGMLDRGKLIGLLLRCRCKWLLSEYPCRDLEDAFGPPLTKFMGVFVNPNPRMKKARREVECLWSNYPAIPNTIDFGDSETPLRESLEILATCGTLSFEEWTRLAPTRWKVPTLRAQFARLTTWPHNYFDGERVMQISKCFV